LKVVKVDNDENLLLVKGSVPGPSGSVHFYSQSQESKVATKAIKKETNYACG